MDRPGKRRAQGELRVPRRLGKAVDLVPQGPPQVDERHPLVLQDARDEPLGVLDEGHEEVLGLERRVATIGGEALRLVDGFL